ncbi:MAG: type II toxin-antitoxin system VapC family toxin [Propionibacteriaceae bacterium]|jgi:PIN domain nuclease of toxin-antitoxin system|nr:type II toxin-antitoxin system VapC family toxin [Propionibacteriaceae bacterium]
MGLGVKLLLDTHTILWMAAAPAKLSHPACVQLAETGNKRFVSAISVLELSIKHRVGKLPEAATLLADLEDMLARLAAKELPITSAEANLAGSLPWENRDPFDRILAAQAIRQNLVLVSADIAFDSIGGVNRLW